MFLENFLMLSLAVIYNKLQENNKRKSLILKLNNYCWVKEKIFDECVNVGKIIK